MATHPQLYTPSLATDDSAAPLRYTEPRCGAPVPQSHSSLTLHTQGLTDSFRVHTSWMHPPPGGTELVYRWCWGWWGCRAAVGRAQALVTVNAFLPAFLV